MVLKFLLLLLEWYEWYYKNTEEYNPNKKRKILIVFDDIIAEMLCNKKLKPLVTELIIRKIKLNISVIFITHNPINSISTHCFKKKIPSKQELRKIAFNHSSDIGFKHFLNLYKNCTRKSYIDF